MRNPIKTIRDGYSPLKIRSSIRRIRSCPDPWSLFFFLFWPLPWRYPIQSPLLPVEAVGQRLDIINERQAAILQLRSIPIFRMRDTPLRSLYRLVEDVCACDFIMMGYECTYFFFHTESRWLLSAVPDPRDDDPVRYAMLASMMEALVDAFNWRLELGIRRDNTLDRSEKRATNFKREVAPSWTAKVEGVQNKLIFNEEGWTESDMTEERNFWKRNIKVPNGYLYTV